MSLNSVLESVTARIIDRSKISRRRYLALMERNREKGVSRPRLACGNLAHAIAASEGDKPSLMQTRTNNIGIISTYNDMLSAHQPYGRYPEQIKLFAREVGATAQVAGCAPAMCDGVTQGQEGMELSLFSRDVIAMSTAVGLSHGMFESVALLGICDKIVPGLLMGALRFGHLPTMLIPAGPMTSGLPNKEKVRIRQLYVQGKVGTDALMEAENASYHSAGTCTFYGTANTNQMMVEIMGLMMPDSAFINPHTKLRQAMTRASIHRLSEISMNGNDARPLAECVDERALVNAAVGLLATGGSTNHTIHLPAIARAAGIIMNWEDLSDLSKVVPLMTRVYPSGSEDVNGFNRVGGMPTVIAELSRAGLLHQDIMTVSRNGFADYAQRATLEEGELAYVPAEPSSDRDVLRDVAEPFLPDGGIKLMSGNVGRCIYKSGAIAKEHLTVEAPARVFHDQNDVGAAFKRGELERDVVVVVRFQGPEANGMPELHKLMPTLGVLQDRGFHVALLTDGRLSGASGKVPSAIHVCPEAQVGGPIAKIKDGDMVRVCAVTGSIEVLVSEEEWAARTPADIPPPGVGTGRELFALMRSVHSSAEEGASAMLAQMDHVLDTVGDEF
ncbi:MULTISPECIES: phosphogluconate dehydratase [Neokomagataea]|uniref:Phosphogluconate dehydratase n=2 Tax=Neokomagataea TaxID=1223423 RepID=A0ABQ0QFW8_9PROT|nr:MULTISPECIES: phosphogluconate dehydratase [Neokomagataea]MBR0558578.1 phosphogluconate dehydratase [Neokomagataea anthophila]GBR43257.1 phosphogluconate dehydratase [Neokomagataea tanensis NBRC 106556]